MSIKKQFYILCISIITIPVLCIIFSLLFRYINSPRRILINEYKELKIQNSEYFSENEWDDILASINHLPPNVEAFLLKMDNTNAAFDIVFSNIENYIIGKKIDTYQIWQTIEDTSSDYFYQFTTPTDFKSKTILVTRLNKKLERHDHHVIFFLYLMTFLFILVFILVFFIIKISRNIFESIKHVEERTIQMANGNLNDIPIPNNNLNKKNEITSICESLEKMRKTLLENQTRKNKFIMGISHDLRTPIAIIKGYAEALSDKIILQPKEIERALDLINLKTNQLEDMINTLINYMKLNNFELREKFNNECITDLIEKFANESQLYNSTFKRKLILNIKFTKKIYVPMDPQLISRVLENLFTNAIRYTHDGDTIRITSYDSQSSVIFEIEDSGVGIEENDLKHIFDLFYRGTNSRKEEGMGIGLSVAKDILDTHGWTIQVKSQKNFGTIFTITIPIPQENY